MSLFSAYYHTRWLTTSRPEGIGSVSRTRMPLQVLKSHTLHMASTQLMNMNQPRSLSPQMKHVNMLMRIS